MVDRNEKGQFVKGAQGISPGRPKRPTEQQYLEAISDIVTIEYWQVVVRRALADAIKGDARARQFLAEYLIGKPPQILELRGGEAQLLAELLDQMKQRGIMASDLFEQMLQDIALLESGEDEPDGQ